MKSHVLGQFGSYRNSGLVTAPTFLRGQWLPIRGKWLTMEMQILVVSRKVMSWQEDTCQKAVDFIYRFVKLNKIGFGLLWIGSLKKSCSKFLHRIFLILGWTN